MALIFGGNFQKEVEAYNPAGGCSQFVGYVPYAEYSPIVGIIKGKITYCAWVDDRRCSQYNSTSNSWTHYTTMKYGHYSSPGMLHGTGELQQ